MQAVQAAYSFSPSHVRSRHLIVFRTLIQLPQISQASRLPIQFTSRPAFSSSTRCYAEPVDLEPRQVPIREPAIANQLENIKRLFASRNWEAVVRIVDHLLYNLETTTTSDPVSQRATFESARGFALDKLGRRKEAIKSYRSAFSGILSSTRPAPSSVPLALECFDSLSALLMSTGSYSEAVTVRKMAVEFIRSLVEKYPAFKIDLVQGLLGLGRSLIRAEDGAGALSALQDAHTLLQEVQGPSTTRIGDLATPIVEGIVIAYQMLGRWSDALPLSEQLIKKGKDALEAAKQSGTLSDGLEELYAYDLCRHADNLWDLGCTEESLATHEQGISIFRRLFERDPTSERSLELAALLHNYSLRQAPQRQFILMKEGSQLKKIVSGLSISRTCQHCCVKRISMV